MRYRSILILAAAALLPACASVSGFPEPAMSMAEEDAEVAPYLGVKSIERYEACADKIACRNTLLDARVRAVDLAFDRHQRTVHGQGARVSLGGDLLSLSLESVAAASGFRAAAAGSGLLTAGRGAYMRQVLGSSTPVLMEQMLARRREVLLRIRQGQRLPIDSYSLFQGLTDITAYEEAGNMRTAAAELTSRAGEAAGAAQRELDALALGTPAAALAAAPVAPMATPTNPIVPVPTAPAPAVPPAAPRLATR